MKTESPGRHNRYAVVGQLLLDGRLAPGALVVDGGRIVDVRTAPAGASLGDLPSTRLTADIVAPGLVDLQVNGAFGVEVGPDVESLKRIAARLPETGVTTFLPTVVSSGAAHYRGVAAAFTQVRAAAAAAGPAAPPSARMPGLHLEGPLLAPSRAGAHAPAPIAAGAATLDDVLDELVATNAVRLVTLAPERPGALDRIRRLRAAGVTVSLGHTEATFEQAKAGIDAGATLVTHLYSAMSPFHHRAPGTVGAALTDDRVTVALIPDGVHAVGPALALALRAKGAGRIVLTTDAISAAGAPVGKYTLGEMEVISDGATARLADGTLAGSTLTMDRAVKNMVALAGATPAEALAAATEIPARLVGIAEAGRFAFGMPADVTLWTAGLDLQSTIVGGVEAWHLSG